MAQQKDTAIYRNISPLIQQQIDFSISNNASSGLSSTASLSGALLANGTVALNGNLSVGTGVTIDGVDIDVAISALQSSVAAVETFAYSGLGLSNTDTGTTYTLILTSSSNPGAAAAILASNSSGGVQLTRLGLGVADATGAKLHVLGTSAEQARISYTANTAYANFTVGSAGELTFSNTGSTVANAHIYLLPGGMVGVGFNTAPTAELQVRSVTEQLRLDYSAAVYASHTISSAGNYTIASTGGNLYTTNHIAHPSYASQLSYWRISSAGEADFRYVYTDELHAKAFIADLEQALAGAQWIGKSVAPLYATITLPTAGNTANMDVEEFAGFSGFRVFVDGDLVRLRQFDRSGGGLKIADAWGTVVYSAQVAGSNPPAQRYIFTRHATYPGTASSTVSAKVLVLDYGVSGNGYMEQNAIDGAAGINSPYYQIVTWNTHPKSVVAGQGLQLRVRLGQLRGLTGSNQWGLYAGTGWTANPQESNVAQYSVTTPAVNDQHRYILAGDNGVQIYNADLTIYSSTTPVISLSRTAPSIAIGAGSDTMTFSAGPAGLWVGNDSGTYKMRLGSVSGGALASGLSWDGSLLRVMGSAYIGNGVGFSVAPLLYCAFDTPQNSTVPNINGHLGQVPTFSGPVTGISTGKYHGALYLEEGTTNLLTNTSFETDLTGVTANGGTLTRVNTFSFFGAWSMRCTSAATGAGWYYNAASVTSVSTQYTWSVYLRGSGNVRLFIYGVSSNIATLNVTLTTTWTRYSLTATFGAGDTARLFGVEQNGAGSTDYYVDGTQIEQRSYPTSYAFPTRADALLRYTAPGNFGAVVGTLSGWFYFSSLTSRTATFFGGDTTGSLTVYANSAALEVSRKDVVVVVTYAVALATNTWYHIAVTWTGGTVTKLYLNGALVGSATAASGYATPNNFLVGAYSVAGQSNINGYIDDVASIDRVLTADEIAAIYASAAPLNVTRSNYELMLANTAVSGYVVGNASGLFGYSAPNAGAGTGAFALVTTASTVYDGESLNAGDFMLGNSADGKANLYFNRSTGRLIMRKGTLERLVINADGGLGIKDAGGTNNVILFSSSTNQILGRLDLLSGGSITAGAAFDDMVLDSTGLLLKSSTAFTDLNSIKWKYSSVLTGRITNLVDTGFKSSTTYVSASPVDNTWYSVLSLLAYNTTQINAALTLFSSGSGFYSLALNASTFTSLWGDTNVLSIFGDTPTHGNGVKVIFIANASTVPTTNATGGGVLYVTAGALKFRGSGGTVTPIAPA